MAKGGSADNDKADTVAVVAGQPAGDFQLEDSGQDRLGRHAAPADHLVDIGALRAKSLENGAAAPVDLLRLARSEPRLPLVGRIGQGCAGGTGKAFENIAGTANKCCPLAD